MDANGHVGDHTNGCSGRPALILVRGGRAYQAAIARVERGWIHAVDVRLKVGDGTHRHVADKSWPRREVREVRWTDEVAA